MGAQEKDESEEVFQNNRHLNILRVKEAREIIVIENNKQQRNRRGKVQEELGEDKFPYIQKKKIHHR